MALVMIFKFENNQKYTESTSHEGPNYFGAFCSLILLTLYIKIIVVVRAAHLCG